MSKGLLVSLALILLWYTSNITVIISNKYLLSTYGFKYPVFLTGCHMLACSFWGYVASALKFVPYQQVQSRWQLAKIAVLASVFCMAVVMGNVSLRYIPVSFNQAIGATTPFFTAIMSFCASRNSESRLTYLSLVPVVLGVIIATGGEPLFNLIGLIAALSATCGRAFKSVLQGLLLTDSTEKMDSMNLLRYMSPIAALLLVPVVLLTERDVMTVIRYKTSLEPWFLAALGANATLAFFANFSNFAITKHTSALTLQVLGNAKGVVAAGISILVFRNPVTLQGGLGYAMALAGVVFYSHVKGRPKDSLNVNGVAAVGGAEGFLPVTKVATSPVASPAPKTTWATNTLTGTAIPMRRHSPLREKPALRV